MKTSLIASLLVLSSSFSSFAQATNTQKATAGTTAAASMVAGYASAKKFIKVTDIEKRFTKVIYRVNGNFVDPEYAANGVKSGDTIRITYTENNRLQVIQSRMQQLRGEINQLQAMITEEYELAERYSKDNFRYLHQEKANPAAAKAHAQEAARLKNIGMMKVAEYNRSMTQIEDMHKPKTIVMKNATPERVSAKIAELRDLRFSVYSVNRVPGAIVKKLATVTKGGAVLAGAAIAIGLVTAEEVVSGKIASSLDAEYVKLKK